jgi:hypothetical protein
MSRSQNPAAVLVPASLAGMTMPWHAANGLAGMTIPADARDTVFDCMSQMFGAAIRRESRDHFVGARYAGTAELILATVHAMAAAQMIEGVKDAFANFDALKSLVQNRAFDRKDGSKPTKRVTKPWHVVENLAGKRIPGFACAQVYTWMQEEIVGVTADKQEEFVGTGERYAKACELLLATVFLTAAINDENGVENAFDRFDNMLEFIQQNVETPEVVTRPNAMPVLNLGARPAQKPAAQPARPAAPAADFPVDAAQAPAVEQSILGCSLAGTRPGHT